MLVARLCPTLCNPVDCSLPGSCVHGIMDKNSGVGCHFFLQGIFSTQGRNLGLQHCGQILYHLSHQGSPLYPKSTLKFLQNITTGKSPLALCFCFLTSWSLFLLVLILTSVSARLKMLEFCFPASSHVTHGLTGTCTYANS